MGRTACFLGFFLLMVSAESNAMQLKWSSGSSGLSFTEATRCTLVVQADTSEGSLPSEWRLLWVAAGFDTLPVHADSIACISDTARIVVFHPPSTLADSTVNMATAQACSYGEPATIATYVLDLPAYSSGKFQVVALDPGDSTRVLRSPIVEFNGGLPDFFPPVVLHATSRHDEGSLVVEAVGVGLDRIDEATLTARDSTWSNPLVVLNHEDGKVTAAVATIATMPACMMQVQGEEVASYTDLPHEVDDPPTAFLLNPPQIGDPEYVSEDYVPKDFCLVYAGGRIHVFYIRHKATADEDSTERAFGHLTTSDWQHWHAEDLNVLPVRPDKWDNLHVWAPYIVQQGLTFYMFYAGVTDVLDPLQPNGHRHAQRLGLAQSMDLITWSRRDAPIFAPQMTSWADTTGDYQMRDPFVMPDPIRPGRWLMYYTAVHRDMAPNQIIGVAWANSIDGPWNDLGELRSTDWFNNSPYTGSGVVESPSLFLHNGRWHLTYTTISGHPTFVEVNDAGVPYDEFPEDSLNWSRGNAMDWYLHHDPAPYFWTALEHFPLFGREFVGGYHNAVIEFGEMQWRGTVPDSFALVRPNTSGIAIGSGVEELSLRVRDIRSTPGQIVFLVQLPRRQTASLQVFDVQGRRVREFAGGGMTSGVTPVTWDGRGSDGTRAPCGVYFARLASDDGVRRARAVLLR